MLSLMNHCRRISTTISPGAASTLSVYIYRTEEHNRGPNSRDKRGRNIQRRADNILITISEHNIQQKGSNKFLCE